MRSTLAVKKIGLVAAVSFVAGAMACVVFGSLFGFITWHARIKQKSRDDVIKEASAIFVVHKHGDQYGLKELIWADHPSTVFTSAPFDALRLKKRPQPLLPEEDILVIRTPTPKDWDYILPPQWEMPLQDGRCQFWNVSLEDVRALVAKLKANQSPQPPPPTGG
jgi:hypothetical protein